MAWIATIPATFFPPLQAGFNASPTIGVAPLAVTFTDTSTGVITNRFWNFGDGTTTNTTVTSLAHTYNATSSYNVQLIVTGPSGASTNSQTGLIVVGNPPQLTVNPASLGYGTQVVGQSSNQNIQVSNTGDLPLTGTVTLATGGTPFTLSTGNLNVPGHQTNTVTVTFSPVAAGSFSNQVVFLSNGGNATNSVNGTAITPAQIAVSPASTNFGTVVLGSYAERTFVVTNQGGAVMSNGVATVGAPFAIMSGGVFSLPGYGSTNVIIRFTPASAGTFSSNVVFATANAGGSTNAVTGIGVTPAQIVVTPASTNLGIVLVGTNASATFLVTNAGGAPLSNGVATVGAPFSIVSGGAFSLAGFSATNVVVRFTPTGDGTVTTNVIFTSNGGNSTNSVTGVGQTPGQIAVTPTNWDYGWVAVGSNAQQAFVVTNRGGAQVTGGAVSVSPPFSVVSGSNFTVVGFGTTNVVVRFAPSGEVTSITNVVFNSINGGSVTNPVTGKGAIIAQPLFSADWTNGAVPLTVTFTDTSTGTITNRNWSFGDGSPATNTAATTISHVYNVAGTNTVALVLTGPVGSRTNSKPGYIVVTNVPPMIASPPQTTTNFVGTTATFSVSATGTAPLAYQWRLYGTNLASQTSATLSRVNVQTNDAGPYTVVVTNVAGGLTSQVATLTVLVPPTIASQPQSATNVLGTTASFSVTASGSTPLAYQWRFYGTNLSGQTSATLSLSNVQTNQAGPYTVVVTNVVGSLTSQVATLTVLVPPTLASQPQSATNVLGSTATFSVTASGTTPLAYQWRFYDTNLVGQTSAALSRANVQTNDAGPYTVVVTNVAGSLTSQVATLTVLVPPTIASQPQSATNVLGSTATFSVTASGTTPLAYQWRFYGTNLSGQTSATLSLSNVQTNQAGPYTVVVTNVVGSLTSQVATLTVLVPPTLASQPQSTTNVLGTTATFSVTASGTAPLAYQWRFYGTNLSGQTSAALSRANVQTNDAGPYTVVVTNVAGSLTSQVATLTVLVPPTIASQPQSATNVLGTTASFSVTASGTAPLAYQWRFYGTNLSGQTSATLSLSNVQTNQAGPYTVVVTNVAGSLTSQVATLAVLVPPTIASQPQSASNVLDTTATFSVTASGTAPLAYQWRFYGTNLSGQISTTLSRANVRTNDAGPYTVVVTNMAGSLTSQVATLTVLVPPTIASQPQSRTNMLGTTASFSVTAFGTAPLAYQWRFNGLEIAGATATNLTLSNVQLTNAGSYVVVVTNVAGVVTSTVAVLTVWPFGSLDHFTWDGIPSPQRVNQAFPVRIAARDSLNNTVSNFSGTASLSGTDGPYTMFSGSGLFPVSFSSTTVGNYFTPNVDLLVTHVVHYGGSQVSLWMADGTLLASEAVSNPSGWMTTALNTPLVLQAGQEYCVSCYSSTNYVTPGFSTFTHGSMGYSRLASGDTFPDGEPLLTQFWVDIRYTVPITITPTVSGAFSGGSWDGNITVTQACAALTLTADDGGGHGGTSGTISVLPLLPQPAFTAAPTNGLAPLRAYFTNLTTGATSYTWQFGNGQTSSLPSPACTYSNAGSYTVKLTAVGAGGTNSLSRTNFIVVTNPPPVIGVTPASYDFLVVPIGTTAQTTFVVTNVGGMTLHGTAVVAPPFAIVSGSNYTVAAYSAANVVVSFTPPAEYGFAGRVIFSSDGGISTNYVTGAGLAAVMPIASFTANPTSGCVPLTVTFTDTSTGTITNRFWDFGDGTTGNVATSLITHAYNLSGTNAVTLIVSGPLGTSTNRKSSYIVVTNLPPLTLAEALDTPGWTWTTGGDASWFTERTVTHDGVDAAQSGAITDSQASWLETTVAGPGTLTFWWKVSSEQDWDYLEFHVNGSQRAFISGEVAWQQKSITLGSGTNTLRWRYWKDDVSSAGQDRGWVDEVSFAPSFPSITAQPQSQTVIQGAAAGFSMTAAGAEPLHYQWWFNGAALSGATSNSCSILAASTNDGGNYLVVVTNDSGSVTSAVAALTVLVPPSIAAQPQRQTVIQRAGAGFGVTAAGTEPLQYQWWFKGAALSGATSNSYSMLAASTNDAGDYFVVVTNAAGNVTSAVATLTVLVPPSIVTQPHDQTVIQGAVAGFSVTAVGTEPLQYQWWFKGAALSGATSNSYSILAASTNNAGNYLVVVTNDSGSVTSAVASLTVFVPPSIVTQPQSQMIPPGSNVTFTVLAVGTDPLSYQWRANGTNIAGATSTTFNLLSVSTNDAGGYVVVVTNWAGSVTSAVATLQVRELLQFQTTGGVMGIVNGSFRVRLIGMSQTSAVVIEASTNLLDWMPLYTNTTPTTLIKYSDPVTTNHPNRFYRAMEVP